MRQEYLARLFRPFSQAEPSTSRRFGGTGLGLTISKRFAEMLGGDIKVHSAHGRGSTFVLTLPTGPLDGVPLRAQGHAKDTPAPRLTPAVPSRVLPRVTGRVLLAEDGPDNQRLISFHLKRAGADVTVVENGQLAVEAALSAERSGNPFGVILMDIQMPVLGGFEATQALRAQGYRRPIVALTAYAMAGDREKCLAAGCDGYATKPIDPRVLLETVATHLRATSGRPDSAATAAPVLASSSSQ
jgi:CheY-like chemotaxis protein